MGKHDSGYERVGKDFYATPATVTQAILVAELFSAGDKILDPCAGDGHMVSAAVDIGINALGADIRDTRFPQKDFLKTNVIPRGVDIVANPPYGTQGRLAVKFIEHALKLTRPRGTRVIMLLPVDFDSGKTRRHLFGDCEQFVRKYVLTDRIRWANLSQKEAGPKENHAWFVWSWQPRLPGGPRLKYLHGTGA